MASHSDGCVDDAQYADTRYDFVPVFVCLTRILSSHMICSPTLSAVAQWPLAAMLPWRFL